MSWKTRLRGFCKHVNIYSMQDTTLQASAQNKPSLSLLEENIRVRLERFSFSAHTPLEHLREEGYHLGDTNTEFITNHLEITILELRYLINDLHWLQWIKARKANV